MKLNFCFHNKVSFLASEETLLKKKVPSPLEGEGAERSEADEGSAQIQGNSSMKKVPSPLVGEGGVRAAHDG